MAKALTGAERLGVELVPEERRAHRNNDAPLHASEEAGLEALHKIGDDLETAAVEIARAADSRATRLPGILRRLHKKCLREPEAKASHRRWWEDRLANRPPELQKSQEGSRLEIAKAINECWEQDDWLSQLGQACRNALVFEHRDIRFIGPRYKKPKVPDTAHVSMEEVGRNLIKRVEGVRTLIPPGFTRLAPNMETNQTLAELADLIGAQCCPTDSADATSVEKDVIQILRLIGPTAAHNHLKQGLRGSGPTSPLRVFEAAFRDWKANLGRFVRPELLPPEEGWQAKFENSQVNLPDKAGETANDLGFQTIQKREAWTNLVHRRNLKPATKADRQWQESSKNWKLLVQAVEPGRPSAFPWTVFAPPTLREGAVQKPCPSLEEVRRWSEANEPDEQPVWKRGNGGLEFRCQLNTPTLDRLRQLVSMCNTGQAAQLRQTLIDNQDLIRL